MPNIIHLNSARFLGGEPAQVLGMKIVTSLLARQARWRERFQTIVFALGRCSDEAKLWFNPAVLLRCAVNSAASFVTMKNCGHNSAAGVCSG